MDHHKSHKDTNILTNGDVDCAFFPRNFFKINPVSGSEGTKEKTKSKKTVKVVQKKSVAINPQVCSLIRRLTEIEWDFI